MSIKNAFGDKFDAILNRLTGLGGSGDKGTTVDVDLARLPMAQAARDVLGRHEGYAVAWLDRVADEGTLSGWYLEDLESSKRLLQLEQIEKDIRLKQTMWLALWSAMRDGGSLVYMATKRKGGVKLREPMKDDEQITALHHFDGGEFHAQTWDADISSPNFRSPKLWSINPTVAGDLDESSKDGRRRGLADTLTELSAGVHWTRVLYVPGRPLTARHRHTNEGIDASYLDAAWDAMKDQKQIDQGGAVLAQEMMQSVLKVAGLEKLEESEVATALLTRMRTLAQAKGLLGTLLIRTDDDYQQKSVNASGFKDLKNAIRSTWAAVTGQPETVAYGATPGGLNTDGEAGRKAWDRKISHSAQERTLRPPLERLYKVLLRSIEGAPEAWRLKFNDLGTLTLKERAEVVNTNALTDKINISSGVYTAEWVAENRYSKEGGYAFELPPVPADVSHSTSVAVLDADLGRYVIEVQTQVAKGGMSTTAAAANLKMVLGLSQSQADALIADHGTSFTVEPEQVVATPEATEPSSQDQPGVNA